MTTTTTRTDIHRPSAINPQDYRFVAIEHDRFSFGAIQWILAQREIIRRHMAQTGGNYSAHQHGGNCHVCGAHCIYTALFYHQKTNTYIRTGLDCAQKMDMGDPVLFRTHKKMIADIRKAQAGKRKARVLLQDRNLLAAWNVHLQVTDLPALARELSLLPETPEQLILDYATEMGVDGDWAMRVVAEAKVKANEYNRSLPFEERTIDNIVQKIIKYGSASDRQYQFLASLLTRIESRPERQKKIEAEKAKAQDAPEDKRLTGVFEVLKVEWKANDDGFGGYRDANDGRYVMVVKHVEQGWAAWGTVPKGLSSIRRPIMEDGVEVDYREGWVQKGEKVELTATFKRSDRDSKFAFFSRPYGKLVN